MEELQITPSQEIFDSISSLQDSKLCYGFGRQEPYVPFIFKANQNEDFFNSNWSQTNEGVVINPREKRKFMKLFDNLSMCYSKSSIAYLSAIAESCFFRVGLNELEC